MNTNRLSLNMQKILIRQMTRESEASQIYLSYGIWADDEGYGGVANFLYRHAQEERNHMIKFMQYILERGGRPIVEAVPAPPADPNSLQDCFNRLLQHEIDNTESIYNIVNTSMKESDWATWNFAQFFVKEQIEEEKLILELIDRLKIAGGNRAKDESLFVFDRALAGMPDEIPLSREATADHP